LPSNPSTRDAIAQAIQGGARTPGAIAAAARLGVTLTYQELDRMTGEGILRIGANGALHLADKAEKERTDDQEPKEGARWWVQSPEAH
jgi:hypothetical protein